MADYSIIWNAPLAASAGSIIVGDVLVDDGTGSYLKATTANRGTKRSTGIAMTASTDLVRNVNILQHGDCPTSIHSLGTGTASWVRCSTTGRLERVSPSGSDDVMGYVETTGVLHLVPGFLTAAIVSGGGAGTPGGADTQVQRNNAGSFGGISGVTTDGTGLTALKIKSSSGAFYYVVTAAAIVADRTLNLPLMTGNDTVALVDFAQTLTNKTIAGASNTLSVRIANDVTGLGTGVATFLGTPSGANLASALTTALPNTKGGTGWDSSAVTGVPKVTAGTWSSFALGTGVETFLVTPSGANLATALTSALTTGKGGTGVTSLTAFGEDITTSTTISAGRMVVASSTTTVTGTGLQSNITGAGKIRFTHASGSTPGGITGGVDGMIVCLIAAGGDAANLTLTHEDASSSAANRILLTGGTTRNVWGNTCCFLIYDGTSSRWREFTALAA